MASFAKTVLKPIELAIRRATLSLISRTGKQTSAATLPDLGDSPSILLLRQDRLGDAIITTPLLYALKAKYPNAKIMMLLGTNNRGIEPMLPDFVQTVVYQKNLLAIAQLILSLRSRKIDVLVDMTDNASVTSSMLVSGIRPRFAVGIEKENSAVYDVVIPRLDRQTHHISERICELLRPFGIDPDLVDRRPKLCIEQHTKESNLIGLNISAGSESRMATPEAWADIVRSILTAYPNKTIEIFAEPKDALLAQKIRSLSGSDAVRTAPTSESYAEFASELSRCAELITPDTSVVHLGAALNIPMTVIYAPIPDGLCYWTPTGVAYSMIVAKPSLKSMDPIAVLSAFDRLQNELNSQHAHASLDI